MHPVGGRERRPVAATYLGQIFTLESGFMRESVLILKQDFILALSGAA
jgi:hypothetical protein